jgi:hypothetical protein
MPLPIRIALSDIEAICGHFVTKPAGVSQAEVIGEKVLDLGKLSALKFWGLIEDTGTKLRLSARGLLVVCDNGAHKARALREVVAVVPPYGSIIVRAVYRDEMIILSSEIAAHWQRHFSADVHFSTLNHQTVCFLRIAEGAGLGRLVVGRKGQQTRFELAEYNARAFVRSANITTLHIGSESECDISSGEEGPARAVSGGKPERELRRGNRVFITHRSNKKILEQIKELVAFGKFEPIVGRDREAAGGPFLHILMDEMRRCDTAIIHVGSDTLRLDAERQHRISDDVLIEIGAAMALYGRNFVLLVEEGVELPSNLQGLCECRYCGDEFNVPAMMKLLRALSNFIRSPPMKPLAITVGADHVVPQVLQYERTAHSV